MANDKRTMLHWRRCCGPWLHEFFLNEFSWRGLGLTYTQPTDFVRSQWAWMKPWLFTVYRVLLAVGSLIWLSMDIPRESHSYFKDKTYIWFVYATNWAFGMLTLVFFLLAIYSLIYNCPPGEGATVILFQPIWLLYTLAANGTIVVCIVFWVALSNSDLGIFASVLGRLKHSLTAVLVLLDVVLSAIPFRLMHVVYPLLGGLIYAVFSYVFWATGGTGPVAVGQVYPGMNWAHPRTTILALLCVLFVSFLIHIALYVTYFIRLKINGCIKGRTDDDSVIRKGYSDVEKEDSDDKTGEDLISVTSVSTNAERANREYGTID